RSGQCCQQEEASAGCILYRIVLGPGFDGSRLRHLWIYQNDLGPSVYTPRSLSTYGARGLKVYRNADHTIRQVLARTVLADVVATGADSFRVDLYKVADAAALERDGDGFLVPVGEPYHSHRFSRPQPAGAAAPSFLAESVSGTVPRRHLFVWNSGENRWTLNSGNGGSIAKETVERYDEGSRTFSLLKRVTGSEPGSAREVEYLYRDFPFGRRMVSIERRIDGKAVSRLDHAYYEDPAEPGRYGQLASTRWSSGAWAAYDYDGQGRLVKKAGPWKDSPYGSPDDQSRIERYSYRPLAPGSPLHHPHAEFARTDLVVAGVPASTTYRLRTFDPVHGGAIRVEEFAASPGAPFGAPGSQRTVSRFHPVREADPASGKLHTTENPDGRIETYTYESGD
ncbi:MAG TPA: hypothetical protein PLA50_11315, partial [Bacteroidia bacterium]|nr:hypothetical protein [Bacteroidia bacterium]